MAFVDWSQIKEVDCSKPYKTFLDLKNRDQIFLINFKELSIRNVPVENVSIKENNDYKILNRFEVSFLIPGVDKVIISDGNCYITKVKINYKDEYIATDNRIAEVIIDLLRSRNSYQWDCLHNIFGRTSNKHIDNNIKLC